jgi:hypothetical protein
MAHFDSLPLEKKAGNGNQRVVRRHWLGQVLGHGDCQRIPLMGPDQCMVHHGYGFLRDSH